MYQFPHRSDRHDTARFGQAGIGHSNVIDYLSARLDRRISLVGDREVLGSLVDVRDEGIEEAV